MIDKYKQIKNLNKDRVWRKNNTLIIIYMLNIYNIYISFVLTIIICFERKLST